MKFFSSDRGFCFGCSVNSSKSEMISTPSTNRRRAHRKSNKSWTPVLNAISEDGVRGRSPQSTSVARSEKKPLNKAKPAGRTRSDSYESDYRKTNYAVALPAFSPTPFLF